MPVSARFADDDQEIEVKEFYRPGDSVPLTQEYADAGVAYNPTTVVLRTRNPAGTIVTQTPVLNPSTGNFKFVLVVDQAGDWAFEWKSTDATHGEVIDSGEIFVKPSLIDSPNYGMVARLVKSLIPVTWDALSKADYYGESLLSERIQISKETAIGANLAAQDEAGFTGVMRDYLATLAAIEIVPAGLEYWMQQKTSVSATGTNETTSYTDRQLAFLKGLLPQLQAKAARLASNPDIVASLTVIGEVPDVSGNDDGVLITENPYDFLPGFADATGTATTGGGTGTAGA